MSDNSYELIYFPVKGFGNMIRIILEDSGVPYKFTGIDPAKWPDMKGDTVFGQLPMLIINGETKLAQSHTIFRYVAREIGLMGSNNLETAQIEMYIDQCIDVRKKFASMIYTDYEKSLQPFLDSIPQLLSPFDKKLQEGDKKHLLFGKLTAADYVLFDVLHCFDALKSGCINDSPNVKAFFENFGAREKLRTFLEKPEIKAMKFTGSGHL